MMLMMKMAGGGGGHICGAVYKPQYFYNHGCHQFHPDIKRDACPRIHKVPLIVIINRLSSFHGSER